MAIDDVKGHLQRQIAPQSPYSQGHSNGNPYASMAGNRKPQGLYRNKKQKIYIHSTRKIL